MKKLALLFFLSCTKLVVPSLNSNIFFSIKLGVVSSDIAPIEKNNFFLPINQKEKIIYSFPQNPFIHNDEILLPIPENNFYVYYKSNDLISIFSPLDKEVNLQIFKNIDILTIPEGRIGRGCITNNYIIFQIYQNYNSEKNENSGSLVFYPEERKPQPSSIFYIDKKDLKKNLAIMELDSRRVFESIYDLYCFNEFINIIDFSDNKYFLYLYNSKLEKIFESVLNIEIPNLGEKEVFTLENIFPYMNNQNEFHFYVDFNIRDKSNYRIQKKNIYKLNSRNYELFIEIEDPEYEIIHVSRDGNLYFVKNDNNDFIFDVYDKNYNYLRKFKVNFDFQNLNWKDYWFNNERFFSSKIENGEYIIIEWK